MSRLLAMQVDMAMVRTGWTPQPGSGANSKGSDRDLLTMITETTRNSMPERMTTALPRLGYATDRIGFDVGKVV
jgi:hypothetical protein